MTEMTDNFFKDFKFIKKAENAKSLSFFCDSNISFFNKEMLLKLKNYAIKAESNIRINLHSSSENTFHNMIIFQWKDTYVRPHKHSNKAETCHILEGEHSFFVFDDTGEILDQTNQSADDTIIYRVEKNLYHSSVPLSDYVIFHESKQGPYELVNDSIFPSWAPENEDREKVRQYLDHLNIG